MCTGLQEPRIGENTVVAVEVDAGTATYRTGNGDEHLGTTAQKILDSLGTCDGPVGGKSEAALSRVIRVTLEWRDLAYKVMVGRRRSRTEKTILQGLSSALPPGRLLAVMGPTGSGKTSMLNALAGVLPAGGSLEGEILVNGKPRGRGFRAISTYVMQDDVLFHNLTVRETIEFAARMRLPASVPSEARSALVTSIINELGLAKAQNTYVGNAFVRGVSGGERKRCNLAIEMISNPSLFFVDEPTSGLDAFQAQNVIESLWCLARGGRSVISTIHQPRSSIYKMFDLLLLLSEGRTIYFGPAAEAVAWFERCGFPCPSHFNPADFFLDLVSLDHRSAVAEEATRQRISQLTDQFQHGQAGSMQVVKIDELDLEAMKDVNDSPGYPNSLPVEFGLLLKRAWKQQSRDRIPQVIAVVQTVLIGLVLAALYSQMEMNQTGINDEIGVLFFITVFGAMSALFGSITAFQVERGVVNRERLGKAYHVLPYYLARSICDLPMRVGQGLLFGVIVYYIVGLNPAAKAFFVFVALLIVEGLAAQGLGVCISAACKDEKTALAVAPAVTVILMLFGGFYVNKDTIPAAIRWIEYLSHVYWGFMGLAINNFRGREGWTCDGAGADGCITTGDQILARLSIEGHKLWQPFLGLSCLIVGYNTLGYALLRFKTPKFLPLTPAPKKA